MILRTVGLIGCIVCLALAGTASAKSLYVISHHDVTFQAYNIDKDDGSLLLQATTSVGDWGPAGLAVHADTATLFVTYEFQSYVWVLDATTMTELDKVPTPGAGDLAGIDLDDVNDIVYAVDRFTDKLYAYEWDRDALLLTLKDGYPKVLDNCEGGLGLAYDELAETLWVACSYYSGTGTARAYQLDGMTGDWFQVDSFVPVIPPVGIAVDRMRGYVYTTAPTTGCANAPSGYTKLSMFDLGSREEVSFEMGHGGMGIAVDETFGYAYLTGGCDGDDIGCWNMWNATDPNHPVGLFDSTGYIGSPAGIATGNVSFSPLNLTKTDGLDEGDCAVVGGTLTYEICFDNTANLFAVEDIVLEDLIPAGMELLWASDGGIEDNGVCRWEFDVLNPDEEKCVQLAVTLGSEIEPGGTIYNVVDIVSTQWPVPSTTELITEVCEIIPVPADIKPGSCPNPFNLKARGKLPVALLGTEDFDITMIDPMTIEIRSTLDGPGVPALMWDWNDVGTPFEGELCDCHQEGADGYMDLTLKFDRQEMVEVLGLNEDSGETVPLMLVGNLYGVDGELGHMFMGSDCVWILGNHNQKPGVIRSRIPTRATSPNTGGLTKLSAGQ